MRTPTTPKALRRPAAVALAAALLAAALPAAAQMGTIRLDQWGFYQENYGDTGRWQYRPRLFVPFKFGDGWTFTQRLDLPFYYTDAQGPANTTGGWKFGGSDAFVEELFESPELAPNFRLKASLRWTFPTGGKGPFGSDQWQIAPMFGAIWRFPEAWRGITFGPFARYSYGYDEGSPGVTTKRTWTIFPETTFTISDKYSLVFWPEQGITYNQRSEKWFVPLEAMFTHRLSKQWEYSVGGAAPMVDDDKSYRWVLQGRLRLYID